jgi:hypothetical protein
VWSTCWVGVKGRLPSSGDLLGWESAEARLRLFRDPRRPKALGVFCQPYAPRCARELEPALGIHALRALDRQIHATETGPGSAKRSAAIIARMIGDGGLRPSKVPLVIWRPARLH